MEYDVYSRLKSANKPKSGVPGDIPRKSITEFGPELATPVCKIFGTIVRQSKQGVVKWPDSWKQEFGTPLQKIADTAVSLKLDCLSGPLVLPKRMPRT